MKRLFGNVVLAAIAAAAIGFFAFNLGNKGASAPTKEAHGHGHEKGEQANSVEMNDSKIAAAGIELLKAGPGVLRDSLLLNLVLAALILLIAWLTGGDAGRAVVFAIGYLVVSTAWSWLRFRQRLARERP